MRIIIAGKGITEQQILQWEQERVAVDKRFLEKRLNTPVPVTNAEELARFKADLPDEKMRSCLQATLKRTTALTNTFTKLAGTKRKISVAEIYLDFCNAVQLHEMYDDNGRYAWYRQAVGGKGAMGFLQHEEQSEFCMAAYHVSTFGYRLCGSS